MTINKYYFTVIIVLLTVWFFAQPSVEPIVTGILFLKQISVIEQS